MATTSRQVIIGNIVVLEIDIKDALGNRIDPDSQPEISIVDSADNVMRTFSSVDVLRIDVGRFRFSYSVPSSARTGIWTDRWRTAVNGFPTETAFNFIVLSQSADIEVAGEQIGDPPLVSYSQEEIIGINILLAGLQARLKNKLQVESVDAYGNIEYVDCFVFSIDELVWFLNGSLQYFNSIPHFTNFSFADEVIYNRFCHVIIEGACILAWSAQMLIEAGKEFTITDNGITMNPPGLSSALNNELSQFLNAYRENVKFIKACIKPHPTGFGTFRALSVNPAYTKLRHLRERRIY